MDKNLLAVLLRPNIYKTAPVLAEPETYLENWQIALVTTESAGAKFHFYGRNCHVGDGRVSSEIQAFDAKTMRGVTRSGRVYQLVGLPGYSSDAEYVFGYWIRMLAGLLSFENGTEEFIQQYGIDLKQLER